MKRIIELFGGICACSHALKNIGIDYELVDYVEIDKYAVASTNAMFGTNFEPQDIKQWNKEVKNIDLIMHGSPCQDFSLAGKGAGGDEGSGTRSSLLYESLRIIEKLKPKYVVWENVKNLLSKKHKHNFVAYLSKMDDFGYKSYYQLLNAKDYGIPQNRERVFTISIRKDIDKGFEFPKPFELKLRLKDMLDDEVDEKYYLSDKMIKYISYQGTKKFKNPDSKINLDIARPITTDQNKRAGTTNYICDNLPDNFDLSKINKLIQDSQLYGTENESNLQACCIYDSNGLSPTLDSCSGDNLMPKILIKNATKQGYLETEDGVYISNIDKKRGTVQKGMIPTLKTSPDIGVVVMENHRTVIAIVEESKDNIGKTICLNSKSGRNGVEGLQPSRKDRIYSSDGIACTIATNEFYNPNYLINEDKKSMKESLDLEIDKNLREYYSGLHQDYEFIKFISTYRVRKLTPKECWRLMGFKDDDFDKANKVNSNTQLYKQAGNSIVVKVLEEIFKQLFLIQNKIN